MFPAINNYCPALTFHWKMQQIEKNVEHKNARIKTWKSKEKHLNVLATFF